jgi:hypothetical protein
MNTKLLTPQEFEDELDDIALALSEDAIRCGIGRPGGGTVDPDYTLNERMKDLVSQWQEMYNKLFPAQAYYFVNQTDSDQPPKA